MYRPSSLKSRIRSRHECSQKLPSGRPSFSKCKQSLHLTVSNLKQSCRVYHRYLIFVYKSSALSPVYCRLIPCDHLFGLLLSLEIICGCFRMGAPVSILVPPTLETDQIACVDQGVKGVQTLGATKQMLRLVLLGTI